MKEIYSYRNNTSQSTNKWIDEGEKVVLFEVKNPWFESVISEEEDTYKQKLENINSNILTDKIIDKEYKFNSRVGKATVACIIMILIIFVLVCIRIYTKQKNFIINNTKNIISSKNKII